MIHEPVVFTGDKSNFSYGKGCRIDSFTKIECGLGVRMGDYVHVASFCHIGIGGGRLGIGSHVSIASGARILTGSNTKDGESMSTVSPMSMQTRIKANTILCDKSFVGAGATIMPGVCVGYGAIVGAGALVTEDVPEFAIVAGVPARQMGYRIDMAKGHYKDVI